MVNRPPVVPQDSAWQPERDHGTAQADLILSGAPLPPCQHTMRIIAADRVIRCFDCGLVLWHGYISGPGARAA